MSFILDISVLVIPCQLKACRHSLKSVEPVSQEQVNSSDSTETEALNVPHVTPRTLVMLTCYIMLAT